MEPLEQAGTMQSSSRNPIPCEEKGELRGSNPPSEDADLVCVCVCVTKNEKGLKLHFGHTHKFVEDLSDDSDDDDDDDEPPRSNSSSIPPSTRTSRNSSSDAPVVIEQQQQHIYM